MDKSKPIAVVTGASTGIGEQISFKLSDSGFYVVLSAVSSGKMN